jgi:hypothetical protein
VDVNLSLINRISASPCPVGPESASWWSRSVGAGGGSAMRVPRWQCGGCQYRGATTSLTRTRSQSASLVALAAAAMARGLVRSVPYVASESESTRRPAPARQGPLHHVGGPFAISRTPAHWHSRPGRRHGRWQAQAQIRNVTPSPGSFELLTGLAAAFGPKRLFSPRSGQ